MGVKAKAKDYVPTRLVRKSGEFNAKRSKDQQQIRAQRLPPPMENFQRTITLKEKDERKPRSKMGVSTNCCLLLKRVRRKILSPDLEPALLERMGVRAEFMNEED